MEEAKLRSIGYICRMVVGQLKRGVSVMVRRVWLAGLSLTLLGLIAAITTAEGLLAPASAQQPGTTPTAFVEPEGCQEPPNDMTRHWVSVGYFNARTLAMLDHAQALYDTQGRVIDLRVALTQGSYTGGALAASFGTHDGGGAVDLSVRDPVTWEVPYDEIEPLIRALRVAGFAAWLRDTGDLYPNSPIHIHAVAVGDPELSEMARAQIDGTFGYLRGFDGLPRRDGIPVVDRHGGPVICRWMIDAGFRDMRGERNPLPTPGGTSVAVTDLP